jgi:hypothetical protein
MNTPIKPLGQNTSGISDLMAGVHNNKMERMNGELRDREKVMRSLKKKDTPILKGMQIYHNFIRPHMALDNQTPASKAGIEIEGLDEWITLIQDATAGKRSDDDLRIRNTG